MPVELEKAPHFSPEHHSSEELRDDFILDAGAEAVGRLVILGVDGPGVSTSMSTSRMSPESTLLNATHPETKGKVLFTKSLDRTIDNASQVVEYIDAKSPLSTEDRESRSSVTLAHLRTESLRLSAPVPAGSEGKELYDLTQRDRKMFEAGATGASKHESYATELFAGSLGPEIIDHIVENLDGKVVFNLGGGNSKISEELAVHGAQTEVINVEPYASDKAKNPNEGYDHLLEVNPAKADFFEKSELPEHSADEIWAVYSVPAYLGTAEEVTNLFDNITALIKPGGVVRISHLGIVGASEGDPRITALTNQLENAKAKGFLLETTKTSRGVTLLMTAPEK